MPLKLVKRHGGQNWYIVGTERGVFVDESTRTHSKEAAEKILLKRQNQILDNTIFGERATVTFMQATLAYLDNGGESRFVQPLVDHFKGRKVSTITQSDIDESARKLYSGKSNATWNRQVYTPMSAILKTAAKRKWCDHQVIERPKQPAGKIRWETVENAQRIVDHASPHMRPLIIFLFGTGVRLSEALYLQWSQVDLKRGTVIFPKTKNGGGRGVPLSPTVTKALQTIQHRIGAVFLTNVGIPYKPADDHGGQIKTGFRGACRRAGVLNFTPHDCRHTFATWHYAKHRDLAQLMQLCGWKSPDMAMRYAHVNVEHLAENVRAMGW
jgi:integrase